jgi:hypothetical protein
MRAVVLHFSFQTLLLEGSFQARHDDFGLEWLDEIIVRALSHGSDAHANVVHARADQERQLGITLPNLC